MTAARDTVTGEDRAPLHEAIRVREYQYAEYVIAHLSKRLRSTVSDTVQAQIEELNDIFLEKIDNSFSRCSIYYTMGAFNKAIDVMDEVLATDAHNPMAWNNKGFILQNLGRYEDALQAYTKACEQNPRWVLPLLTKADLLMNTLGSYDEALATVNKLLSLEPKNPETWIDNGLCLCELNRHKEALQAYDQALTLDPGNTRAWNNKGRDLERLARYGEALRAYSKALELDPSHEEAGMNRNKLLAKLKENKDLAPHCPRKLDVFSKIRRLFSGE